MYFWSFLYLILIVEAGLCVQFHDEIISFSNLDKDLCFSGFITVTELPPPYLKYGIVKQNNVDIDSLLFGKSAKSFINELASFNELHHKYELVEEQGPAHEKEFTVQLKLGNEEYLGRGPKIKKAEQDAAAKAIEQTGYKHPKIDKPTFEISPKDLLQKITEKHGLSAKYESVNKRPYCYSELTDYNCYSDDQICPIEPIFLNDVTVSQTDAKAVRLIIDNKAYTGSGTTEELAQQDAAYEAFQDLKHLLFDLKSTSSKSFVSTVYEKSQQLKMNVVFNELETINSDLFKTECKFGNKYSSIGNGTSRQKSKQAAAEEMLKILDSKGLLNSTVFKNKKKRKKKIVRNFTTRRESTEYTYFKPKPSVYNELQKALRYLYKFERVEPEYEFKKKVTFNGNTVFLTKITVKEHEFIANGTSKQESKFRATHGMLKKLGYRSPINDRNDKEEEQNDDLNRLHMVGKIIKPGMMLVSASDVPSLQRKDKDLHKFKTLLLRKPDGSLKYITNSELLMDQLKHKLNLTIKYFKHEHKVNNKVLFNVSVTVSLPNFRNIPANLIYCEHLLDPSLKNSLGMVSSRAIAKLIELGLIDISVNNLSTGTEVKIDSDAIRINEVRFS